MSLRNNFSYQTNQIKRSRYWSFIVYLDSIIDFDDFISNFVSINPGKMFCSPLFDMNRNPHGGQEKPHYHCLIISDSVKSYNQVCDLLVPLGVFQHTIAPCIVSDDFLRYINLTDSSEDKIFARCETYSSVNKIFYIL